MVDANIITQAIFKQLMGVMGQKQSNWLTRLLYPPFSISVKRLAKMAVALDTNIAQIGWNPAVNQFMQHLVRRVIVLGAEVIPDHGPLMVICNHPAAYDVGILIAATPREDLKVVVSDIPVIQLLPNIAAHCIPVPYYIPGRLKTVRSTIQHLREDGCILIFPRGNVEPDPAVSPGAAEYMAGWSPSLELFLRQVPETRTVVAIASGMLSAKWYYNPVVKRWKKYEQRQKVAEIFQIAAQLLTGSEPSATPTVSFAPPLSLDQLGGVNSPEGTLLASLVAQAKILLNNIPQV